MHFAGVDIGSTMTKVVLIDKSDNQLSCIKGPTGPEHRRLANEVMRQALKQASLQNVASTRQAEGAARNLHDLGQNLKRLGERDKVQA